jgi:hypothetical protein
MAFFKPRGVLDCKASDVDDPSEDARFGRVGKQVIEDTGPLTRERMTTVEDDLLAHSLDFIDRSHAADTPFFLWHNTTRMHVWTRLSERWKDNTKYGLYADGLQEMDWVVGELLGKLDELGIAEDTIVIWTTDNGAEKFTWPDGGTTPFRGEKGLGWEGGFRVPFVMRWPGRIPAGQVLNDIVSLEDVVPTIMAAVGVDDIRNSYCRGTRPATSSSESISTATTNSPTSLGRARSRRATSSSTTGNTTCSPPLPQLEDPLPGQGRLVQRAVEADHRAATGQPACRPVRAAHGCAVLPDLRGREAVDGPASPATYFNSTPLPSRTSRPARRRPTSTPRRC